MPESHVALCGNLTRDPELRFTPTGQAVCTFGLAVNRRWFDQAKNEWSDEVAFVDVTCWRLIAEGVAASLLKGNRVVVVGRIDYHSWVNEEGKTRAKVEVVAEDVGASIRFAQVEVHKRSNREVPAGEADGALDGAVVPGAAPEYREPPF